MSLIKAKGMVRPNPTLATVAEVRTREAKVEGGSHHGIDVRQWLN